MSNQMVSKVLGYLSLRTALYIYFDEKIAYKFIFIRGIDRYTYSTVIAKSVDFPKKMG